MTFLESVMYCPWTEVQLQYLLFVVTCMLMVPSMLLNRLSLTKPKIYDNTLLNTVCSSACISCTLLILSDTEEAMVNPFLLLIVKWCLNSECKSFLFFIFLNSWHYSTVKIFYNEHLTWICSFLVDEETVKLEWEALLCILQYTLSSCLL
jgi:hypothetical protein